MYHPVPAVLDLARIHTSMLSPASASERKMLAEPYRLVTKLEFDNPFDAEPHVSLPKVEYYGGTLGKSPGYV